MFIKRRRRDIRNLYREYRRSFWILVGATFIDRLGGSLLFPFFALYITKKFNVGMTEVGCCSRSSRCRPWWEISWGAR